MLIQLSKGAQKETSPFQKESSPQKETVPPQNQMFPLQNPLQNQLFAPQNQIFTPQKEVPAEKNTTVLKETFLKKETPPITPTSVPKSTVSFSKNGLDFDSILKNLPERKKDPKNGVSPTPLSPTEQPTEDAATKTEVPPDTDNWTKEEDKLLKEAIRELGFTDWAKIAERVPPHTYEECIARWMLIRPPKGKSHAPSSPKEWTPEEDEKLLELIEKHKFQWGQIAKELKRQVRECKDR